MTITYVGAGTAASGNNVSVTPGMPAGLADLDTMILVASIRNSGAGTVDTPAGWTRLTGSNNLAVFGRIRNPGDVAPLVTFTGGVAGADTGAQIFAFRDAERTLGTIYTIGQLNVSAQDVAYPALNITGPGQAVLIIGWKQDDVTSYSIPAGFTGAGIVNSTAGDDASQAVRYQIQVAEADIAAGALTVVGGVAAISRAIVLAIRPNGALTAAAQASWPPRVLVTLTGTAAGDAVAVYRVVDGVRTALRAGSGTAVDAAWVVVDAELPFGVPVHYEATVNTQVTYTSADVTYALPGGKNALTDAISGLAAEVVIQDWAVTRRERRNAVFRTVDGRNVVVVGALGQRTSTVTLYTETESSGRVLEGVLEATTQGVIQFRQGTGATGVDSYQAVLGVEEERYDPTQGEDPKRLWRIDVAETDAWGAGLAARGYTYGDLKTSYTGLTYANLLADYPTYLAVRQGDYS
jgi:hypothetical protein